MESNELLNLIQKHLEQYALDHTCYLDLFLNVRDHNATNIYSEYRGKTLPKNPYFILENDPGYWSLKPPTQPERAAILTFSTLKFVAAARSGKLRPDVTPQSRQPLTMNLISYLFGSTRYVSAHGNGINIRHNPESRHLVILCEGRFYYLDVLGPKNEVLVDQQALHRIFAYVLADKDSTTSICLMTTESRENWAEARRKLDKSPQNQASLALIDSALLVVNLDTLEYIISDKDVQYRDICHGLSNVDSYGIQRGSCALRWYDKLQLLISKDSLAAVIWEPTSNDATVVLRYVSDIYTDLILRLARGISDSKLFTLWPDVVVNTQVDAASPVKPSHHFYRIQWDLQNPKLMHRLRLAETRMGDLLCQLELYTAKIPYGHLFAKQMGLNTDLMMQLVIQLAHYALYGRVVSSAEAVSTRQFEHSRSELCFIQSMEVAKVCQAFISTADDGVRWELVKAGVEDITKRKKMCREGGGFEKHMKALKLAYLQRKYLNEMRGSLEAIPEPEDVRKAGKSVPRFLLEATEHTLYFQLLFDPEILAINCGNPALKAFGLTPYKPTGFGIGYILKDEYSVVSISSNFRQNKRLLSTMKWVFEEIRTLHKRQAQYESVEISDSVPYSTTEMLRSVSMSLTESIKRSDEGVLMLLVDSEEQESADNILGGYGYFDVGEMEVSG